jgi:hypothetical protein
MWILRAACIAACLLAAMVPAMRVEAASTIEKAQHDGTPQTMTWSLRLPEDNMVAFRGALDSGGDSVTGWAAAPMYPAPNFAGFIAAIITHGVVVETVRDGQRNKLQENADRVLLPYREVLSSYNHRELMQRGLEKSLVPGGKLVEHSVSPGAEWLVAATPVFTMTQDQTAIILDNFISMYAPGSGSDPARKNVVRVVSRARDADLHGTWIVNNGKELKEESSSLFAESLEIFLSHPESGEAGNQRTIRYFEGSAEKMERGQIISERCSRVVFRTLRGWLKSVPARSTTAVADGHCGSEPTAPKQM